MRNKTKFHILITLAVILLALLAGRSFFLYYVVHREGLYKIESQTLENEQIKNDVQMTANLTPYQIILWCSQYTNKHLSFSSFLWCSPADNQEAKKGHPHRNLRYWKTSSQVERLIPLSMTGLPKSSRMNTHTNGRW